jgi:hypothetical protein
MATYYNKKVAAADFKSVRVGPKADGWCAIPQNIYYAFDMFVSFGIWP